MARIIEPQVSVPVQVRSFKLDNREFNVAPPAMARVQEPSSGLLDDDLIPDSRIYIRPAAIVEAKLNSRINASSKRYSAE